MVAIFAEVCWTCWGLLNRTLNIKWNLRLAICKPSPQLSIFMDAFSVKRIHGIHWVGEPFFSGIHTFGQSKMYELLNMPLIPHYVPLIPHGASTHGPRLHVGHLIPQLRSQWWWMWMSRWTAGLLGEAILRMCQTGMPLGNVQLITGPFGSTIWSYGSKPWYPDGTLK